MTTVIVLIFLYKSTRTQNLSELDMTMHVSELLEFYRFHIQENICHVCVRNQTPQYQSLKKTLKFSGIKRYLK